MDMYPTFAAVAAAPLPAEQPTDGADLSALFADTSTDPDRDRNSIFWHLPGYLNSGGRDQRPQSVVRSKRWKLLYSYETRTWELYDLATDLGETTNLAASEQAVLEQLGVRLIYWLADVKAPLATLRAGRQPVSFTVRGMTYANGGVTQHHGDTIVVGPGDEMPVVLPYPA